MGGERTQPLDAGLLVIEPAKGAVQAVPGPAADPGPDAGLVLFASIGASGAELLLCSPAA